MKAADLLRKKEPEAVDPESREGKRAALAERRKNAPAGDFTYVEGSWGDVGYTLTPADFTTEELVALADGCYLDAYKDEGMGGNGTKWRKKAEPAMTEPRNTIIQRPQPVGPPPNVRATGVPNASSISELTMTCIQSPCSKAVDASGELPDGTRFEGPDQLKAEIGRAHV